MNRLEDRAVQSPADPSASASYCPESEAAGEDSRDTQQNPVANRKSQTASGILPVLSY